VTEYDPEDYGFLSTGSLAMYNYMEQLRKVALSRFRFGEFPGVVSPYSAYRANWDIPSSSTAFTLHPYRNIGQYYPQYQKFGYNGGHPHPTYHNRYPYAGRDNIPNRQYLFGPRYPSPDLDINRFRNGTPAIPTGNRTPVLNGFPARITKGSVSASPHTPSNGVGRQSVANQSGEHNHLSRHQSSLNRPRRPMFTSPNGQTSHLPEHLFPLRGAGSTIGSQTGRLDHQFERDSSSQATQCVGNSSQGAFSAPSQHEDGCGNDLLQNIDPNQRQPEYTMGGAPFIGMVFLTQPSLESVTLMELCSTPRSDTDSSYGSYGSYGSYLAFLSKTKTDAAPPFIELPGKPAGKVSPRNANPLFLDLPDKLPAKLPPRNDLVLSGLVCKDWLVEVISRYRPCTGQSSADQRLRQHLAGTGSLKPSRSSSSMRSSNSSVDLKLEFSRIDLSTANFFGPKYSFALAQMAALDPQGFWLGRVEEQTRRFDKLFEDDEQCFGTLLVLGHVQKSIPSDAMALVQDGYLVKEVLDEFIDLVQYSTETRFRGCLFCELGARILGSEKWQVCEASE
jgi:hypothetical protein